MGDKRDCRDFVAVSAGLAFAGSASGADSPAVCASPDDSDLSRGLRTKIFDDLFAFEDSLRNGVYLTVADLTGDGYAELEAGDGPGGGPCVLALDGRDLCVVNKRPLLTSSTAILHRAMESASQPRISMATVLPISLSQPGTEPSGVRGRTIRPTSMPASVLEIRLLSGTDFGVYVG